MGYSVDWYAPACNHSDQEHICHSAWTDKRIWEALTMHAQCTLQFTQNLNIHNLSIFSYSLLRKVKQGLLLPLIGLRNVRLREEMRLAQCVYGQYKETPDHNLDQLDDGWSSSLLISPLISPHARVWCGKTHIHCHSWPSRAIVLLIIITKMEIIISEV